MSLLQAALASAHQAVTIDARLGEGWAVLGHAQALAGRLDEAQASAAPRTGARSQRALNRTVYVTDTSGQERVVTILGTAADVVTVSVGRQWMTMHRDTILAMDRVQRL